MATFATIVELLTLCSQIIYILARKEKINLQQNSNNLNSMLPVDFKIGIKELSSNLYQFILTMCDVLYYEKKSMNLSFVIAITPITSKIIASTKTNGLYVLFANS